MRLLTSIPAGKRHHLKYILFCLCLLLLPLTAFSQQQFEGEWYQVNASWGFSEAVTHQIETPVLTGGNFVFQASFDVLDANQARVIDFKNASVLGYFHHYITDSSGKLVAEFDGGIQSKTVSLFFMRHGREFTLPPGNYQLTTLLSSPYFIAEPQPYWDTLSHYRQAIKWGNFIGLVSIGILLSLGVYYAILAYVRKRTAEIMYTTFIWMNVIFSCTSMLITPDLFGLHWFYLAGAPLLLSNMAYVLFAKSLLQIRQHTHPKLDRLALLILIALGVLLLIALLNKNWILECARLGVGLMMSYGLIAALYRAYEGYKIAYFYLIAVFAFFIIGSIAISSSDLDGIYTIYVEHIGLLAVTTEVLLIGLVLGYQFAQIYREKEHNLRMIEHSLQIAHHDSLTGLPNRYALDLALTKLDKNAMLMLLDMDNLKMCNDLFGHQKGDELLQMFAKVMSKKLGDYGVLHRMGGDEFVVTSADANFADNIKKSISETMQHMQLNGFEKAGISFGLSFMNEARDADELLSLADNRMYQHKRREHIH
ncbi:diguanylate cyclase domain-containing protein [Neptunomonas antarctica]|uniref:diguanylate cyclase n=1 Tax=Neptunomonas antarctica TaxID=619304 RepID=A0A1N7M519_9GAMM|nr:diguanylate cyclase [Neptunomonas antarctica]SIS81178.1 diguanylate cyclase (GGDEF) domain-containing protein [Neptunomonas antarctica]